MVWTPVYCLCWLVTFVATRGSTLPLLVCILQTRVVNGSSSNSHEIFIGPKSRLQSNFVTHLWPPGDRLHFASVSSKPIFFRLITTMCLAKIWIPIYFCYSLVQGGQDLKYKGEMWHMQWMWWWSSGDTPLICAQSNITSPNMDSSFDDVSYDAQWALCLQFTNAATKPGCSDLWP